MSGSFPAALTTAAACTERLTSHAVTHDVNIKGLRSVPDCVPACEATQP
jgi:hypothetical protein